MSLANHLAERLEAYSSEPALWVRDRFWSYGEIRRLASRLAAVLERHVPPGGAVGILAQRSLAAYVGILGSVLAGRPYVPLNMKFPFERQLFMARMAGCAVLISDADSEERREQLAMALDVRGPRLADAALTETPSDGDWGSAEAASRELDDAEIAYVMFTSGTTGEPKGVAVRRENLLGYLDAIETVAPVTERPRCSHLFDLSFDLSVHDIFRTWTAGGCLFVMKNTEMLDPVGFASRHGLDCWFSVPSVVAMAKRMRRLKPGALPSLRLSLFCGEPLPFSYAEEWRAVAPNSRLLNLYGPTEATIAITAQDVAETPAGEGRPSTVPLGRPFPGSDAIIVTDAGAPAVAGEAGELWLGGRQISDGYLKKPEETAARFVEASFPGSAFRRWYRTGDLVLDDPLFGKVFQGRLDDQVKIQGYRVELLEIEEVLRSAAGTVDVAAVVWPISELGAGEGVVGFVSGSTVDPEAIIAACQRRLPNYMTPKRILSVDDVPLNSNGKVDRRALRKLYLEKERAGAV